jgi:hypothetical protein
MLIRNTLIVGAASFALAIACFAGVAAIAGPEIVKNGWTLPFDNDGDTIVVRENGKVIRTVRHVRAAGERPSPTVDRTFAWTGKDQLIIDLPVDVVFVQGAEAKVVASGPKSYIDRLRVSGDRIGLDEGDNVDHDTLTIDHRGIRVQSDSERVKITVVAPDVTKFDVRGERQRQRRRRGRRPHRDRRRGQFGLGLGEPDRPEGQGRGLRHLGQRRRRAVRDQQGQDRHLRQRRRRAAHRAQAGQQRDQRLGRDPPRVLIRTRKALATIGAG